VLDRDLCEEPHDQVLLWIDPEERTARIAPKTGTPCIKLADGKMTGA
jgi:hypothetical protein